MRGTSPKRKRLPTEAALLFLSSLLHDLSISVNLTGNHEPAVRDVLQDRRYGLALRQDHETMAFFGLKPAVFCAVHGDFFRVTLDSKIQPLGEFMSVRHPTQNSNGTTPKIKRDHSL